MATVKFRWKVNFLTNVMENYDTQKVWRATTSSGPWVEITTALTRVDLVTGQNTYYFDDTAGDPSWWYATSYFHSTSLLESSLSIPQQGGNPGYISLTDVRNAGVTEAQASDDEVWASIEMWTQFIDMATRQWFVEKILDVKLDGNGTRVLHFKVPIIEITELYMNKDFTTVVPADQYEVYNNLGEGVRDDRRDPKIALADQQSSDLYERLLRKSKFTRGRKNQRVVGKFGFIEPDGSPPALIQHAMLKLVVRQLTDPNGGGGSVPIAGPMIAEVTDGHSRRYATLFSGTKPGTVLLTGDSQIDAIINYYKTPKVMRLT
jgi:hypothetical protein